MWNKFENVCYDLNQLKQLKYRMDSHFKYMVYILNK